MKKIKDIDAILFDLMGVLLFKRKDYVPDKRVDEIDKQVGQVLADDKFKAEVLTKYKLADKEFNDILKKIVNKYEPFGSLWKMLPELRAHYKLAIANNGTFLTFPFLDTKYNISENFDYFFSSAQMGIKKPAPEFFILATKKLGTIPARCLFMDDSSENIQGAQSLGMRTIRWSNKEEGFETFLKFVNL